MPTDQPAYLRIAGDLRAQIVSGELGPGAKLPTEAVMRTRYRFLADGEPIQLSTSWEPLTLTIGTPVERPENGPQVGVVARMDTIGVHIDECEEKVADRPAHADEIEALDLSPRRA